MERKFALVAIVVAVLFTALLLFGCPSNANSTPNPPPVPAVTGPPSTATGGTAGELAVEIKNFAFSPAEISIVKGSKVTWTNNDAAPHTITSAGNFDSGTLQKGESYSKVFDVAGTYEYNCAIHTSMKGKLVVS